MIKSNRQSQESILQSGYRNRLKEYGENSQFSKTSKAQTQKSRSKISRQLQKDQRRSRQSQHSRNTSVQRAFNQRAGSQHSKNQGKMAHIQAQSQVQPFLFIQNQFQLRYFNDQSRHMAERHLSQPVDRVDISQSGSQVKTQIQNLNRLREEYEILKQVTSDVEYRQDNPTAINSSNINNLQEHSTKPRYIYESRESIPVEVIKNKKLNKTLIQKNHNQIGQLRHNNTSNKNPQKEQNSLTSSEQHSQEIQSIKPKTSKHQSRMKIEQQQQKKHKHKQKQIESDLQIQEQIKQINEHNQRGNNFKKEEYGNRDRPISQYKQIMLMDEQKQITFSKQVYLVQISSLQSALTQSSLKIEELLTQVIKNKSKLKEHQQTIERNHRLQNQLRLMKQTEKYLRREMEMKEDESKRLEKRTRLMKETIQMLEKQLQLKEREITALDNLIQKNRTQSNHRNTLSGTDLAQSHEEALQRINLLTQENQALKNKLKEQHQLTQTYTEKYKNNSLTDTEHLKTYFTQTNNQLKLQLEKTQHQLFELKTKNNQLQGQIQQHHSKNHMHQTISSKIHYVNINTELTNQHNKDINQSQSFQTQQVNQSLQAQQAYIQQLHIQMEQLQEIIKSEDNHKQQFIHEVQTFRNQQIKLIEENTHTKREITQTKVENALSSRENVQLKRELHQLKIQMNQLKTQLNITKTDNNNMKMQLEQFKINSVSKEQFFYLQKEKEKLSNELNMLQRMSTSLISHQDQQLLANLNSIKEEYLKLQQAYMEKAKLHESSKSQLIKAMEQLEHFDIELNQLEREVHIERSYSTELQQKIHQKEIQLIEFLNLAQNNNTYANTITQLQHQIADLEIKLKQKDSLINHLQMEHKNIANHESLNLNQLKLQLSQSQIQNINLKASYNEQIKQFNQQIQNYQKQIQSKNIQQNEQQKHYAQINKIDKQMMEKQVKILQNQLFLMLQEKQKLIQQTIKIGHLQHQLQCITIKQRNSRKITQSIDHLWMIKQAEYWNVNQIINLSKTKLGETKDSTERQINNKQYLRVTTLIVQNNETVQQKGLID